MSIQRLAAIPASVQATLRAAQEEAARVWNDVAAIHRQARVEGKAWPRRKELQEATKGKYALHSQSVQMVCHQLLANVEATTARRQNEPASRRWLRYPYKEKRFMTVSWPAQAVGYDAAAKRLVLPMGRGRKSLAFRLDLGYEPGAVDLVWNEGVYALHIVRSDVEQAAEPPGPNRAAVDLGEIHLAAVATDTGKAMVVTGRAIRSHKRLLSKQIGEIARLRSRCKRGSKRWRKLIRARQRLSARVDRRVRDLRHKATRAVIDFCVAEGVGELYVGDPRGVRKKNSGRRHNQRMARWEMGKDLDYLGHKAERARITCSTGDERGTSSRCPCCGHRHRPKGRTWQCRKCGFEGHRDVVGATNMHVNGFGRKVTFPAAVTYRRPGSVRVPERRRSPDTGPGGGREPAYPALPGTAPPQGGMSGGMAAAGSPARRKTQRHAA